MTVIVRNAANLAHLMKRALKIIKKYLALKMLSTAVYGFSKWTVSRTFFRSVLQSSNLQYCTVE
jgi:hypothetical protein